MKNFLLGLSLAFLAVTGYSQTVEWTMKANPALQSINGVAFRADGQKVLSGTNCHPASLRVFDVANGNMDWDFEVGSTYMCIMGVTFSSNGNYIAAIEEFGNIFIFDNTGASPVIIDTINTGTSYGFSTAISPANDKVIVGCSNGKMIIYNLVGGTLVSSINAHPSWVTTVAYSPNGNYIVTGGSDNKIKIWSSAGALLFTCNGHTDDVTNVKVTPDNNFVVSSAKDDKIKIWNIATGALVQTINGHSDDVNGIDISPDGTKIVSASADSTCRIWDFTTGSLFSTFGVKDSGAINTVAWSPSGDKIVTGNALSDVVLWNLSAASGINDVSTKSDFNLSVFPNPATEQIQFNLPANINIKHVEIADVNGRAVFCSDRQEHVLSVSPLTNGIYYLSVLTTNNQKAIQSFIKN